MSDGAAENKRARVRRILIEPLEALGFRRNAKIPADVFKTKMANMIDQLVYLSDDSLSALFEMVKSKGQGAGRNLWPEPSMFLSFAELVQPRPIEELPGLLRWFRSVAGQKALSAGTLVETWQYFHRHKRPPQLAGGQLQSDANRNHSRCQRTRERMVRGTANADDVDFLKRYEARLAYCQAIVEGDDLDGAA